MQITIRFLFLFSGIVHAFNCGNKVRHLSRISSPIISTLRYLYLIRMVFQNCWAACVCAYCHSSGTLNSELAHYCLDLNANRDICRDSALCPSCTSFRKPDLGALSFSEYPRIDQVISRQLQNPTCDPFPHQFLATSNSPPISGDIALALVDESTATSGEEPFVSANLDEVYTPPSYYPIPWIG